jgi:hypothetical protein
MHLAVNNDLYLFAKPEITNISDRYFLSNFFFDRNPNLIYFNHKQIFSTMFFIFKQLKNLIFFLEKNYIEIKSGGLIVFFRKLNNLVPFCERLIKNIFKNLYLFFFSKLNLELFILKQRIDKKKYILFLHGSTADIFVMASLIDNFCQKHGEIELIISSSYLEIIKRLCHSSKIRFIIISEKKCVFLRSNIKYLGNYQDNLLKPGIIKPLHFVLYTNLLELSHYTILHYREALNWVLNLDKETRFSYPIYSCDDEREVNIILNKINSDFNKIIIINPITYTHSALPNQFWEDFANVFKTKGYTVVFNLKKNSNDSKDYEFSSSFPFVYLPAYLIPLISEKIAFFCARQGGGFDLAHSFNEKSKAVLLLMNDTLEFDTTRVKDYPIEYIEEVFLNFCNKKVYKILCLSELKVNSDLLNQIDSIENV